MNDNDEDDSGDERFFRGVEDFVTGGGCVGFDGGQRDFRVEAEASSLSLIWQDGLITV